MRILFIMCCLTMMLSLGFAGPLAAKEGGKSDKTHAKANGNSGKKNHEPRAKDDSKQHERRPGDRDQHDNGPGDRDRHDGDRDRNDGDQDRHDGDHDRDHHWSHDGDHHDHDWDRGDHDGDRGDWWRDGERHDNGLHRGWYKNKHHDDWWNHHDDDSWNRHDHDGDNADHRGDGDRDRSQHEGRHDDWNSWRAAQARYDREQQLLTAQRNRDRRVAEAQYLREIAERNGNANLATTADRMQQIALEDYARRAAELERYAVTDPMLDLPPAVAPPPAPFWLWNWWPFNR